MPFYATANGTGRIHLYGKPGAFSADIDMRPDKGTLLVYTVDNPETSTDGALLQFRDKADVLQRIDSISHQLRLQPTEHEAMSPDSLFLQASATKPAAKPLPTRTTTIWNPPPTYASTSALTWRQKQNSAW